MLQTDLVAIASGDPIRQSLLRAIYDATDLGLQPAYEIADGYPSGQLVDITSTSFVEISPLLTVSFTHSTAKNIVVLLPISINVGSLTTVAEIGIELDGVVDTYTVIRHASTATGAGLSPSHAALLFPLGLGNFPYMVNTAGLHVIKPVAKIVSGTTPHLYISFNRQLRVIVRDM